MKDKKIQQILLVALLSVFCFFEMTEEVFATQTNTIDVTPPLGKLMVAGAIEQNGELHVSTYTTSIGVYAVDDVSKNGDIKVYISQSPIENVPADSEWQSYYDGMQIELDFGGTNGQEKVYAIFKDAAGNTSKVYSTEDTKYIISYDIKDGQSVNIEDQIGYYGMPQSVTSIKPHKDGMYFLGWSLSPAATAASYMQNDIIPAYVLNNLKTSGTMLNIKLYAVYSSDVTKLPLLSEVAKVGDYVDYPVYYSNVTTNNTAETTQAASTYTGWRVISKDIDLDGNPEPGTVNLVSAGVPMTFYNFTSQANSLPALLENFLETPFALGNQVATYRLNGFSSFATLTEIFTNKFTKIKADGKPAVRPVVAEDILKETGSAELILDEYVNDTKYNNLFSVGSYYWLASAYLGNVWNLWYVSPDGYLGSHNNELGVRPVVSLKSTVRTKGIDILGKWEIEIGE